ncbi:MAG: DUF2125 domain-containing protein [Alphaproteobacteria bacterium]
MPMRKRLPYIIVAASLALVALYAGLWWAAASALRERIEAAAAERSAKGHPTGFATLVIDGFPFALRARIDGAEAALEGPLAGMTWHGDAVIASVRPWAPRRARLRLEGAQEIRAPEDVLLAATGREITADIRFDGAGRVARVDARLRDATLTPANGAPTSIAAADIAYRAESETRAGNEDGGVGPSVSIDAADIRLAEAAGGALGRRLGRLIVEGRLTGDLPADATARALAAWRDAGGTVEITHAEARWGPLHLAAVGTLTLDTEMRPLAAFSARIVNYEAALDAFVAKGALGAREAAIAKTVFALVAKRATDGGPPALEAALTIQDGRLSVGPVPLFRVPALDLPQ